MRRPTFMHGAALALCFAAGSAITDASLAPVFGHAPILKLIIVALSGLYVMYLLASSGAKTGRLTVTFAWIVGVAVIDAYLPGMLLFSAAHLGMVWLVRALYFHGSAFTSLADLALCAFSLAAAIAAAEQTHSIFLTVWTFFLLQALFVAIPPTLAPRSRSVVNRDEDRFDRARRSAEAALRRIHTNR